MRSVSFSYLILIPNLLHLKILKNFFVYCTVHWSRHLHHPRHILSDIMLGRRNWRTKCFVQQFHGEHELGCEVLLAFQGHHHLGFDALKAWRLGRLSPGASPAGLP